MKPERVNIAHTNFSHNVSTYSAPSNTSLIPLCFLIHTQHKILFSQHLPLC